MTTTNVFQGLGEGKNSSRVLRPPGGGSSNIFGGGDPEPQQAKPTNNRNKSSVMDGACELGSHQQKQPEATRVVDESAVNPQERLDRKAQQGQSDIFNVEPVSQAQGKRRGQGVYGPRTDQPAFNPITGENQAAQVDNDNENSKQSSKKAVNGGRGGFNPITGEAYPAAKDTPSTKVRQPPGGASSGLW